MSAPPATPVALVTGAAGGIGSATLSAFADAGFDVVGTDRVDAVDVTAELKRSEEAKRVVDTTISRFGRLDALLVMHGISGRSFGDGPVADCSEEGWDRVLDANLRSVFLICKHAIPHLLATRGAIVTLASVLGLVGGDSDFATHAYAASKAGIVGLTRAMAATYAPSGLRSNAIAPGLVATPMSARAQNDPRIRSRLVDLQPLTNDFIPARDIAEAALYLARATSVTGVVLPVDAGWTAR